MKYNLSLAASGQDEVVAVGGGLTSFALDTQTNTLYGAAQDDGKGLTFISFDVTSRTSTVKALHGRTFTFTLAITFTFATANCHVKCQKWVFPLRLTLHERGTIKGLY